MTNVIKNEDTVVVRSLLGGIKYLPREGLNVVEVPVSSSHSYVFVFPNNPAKGKRMLVELSQGITQALLPQMLDRDDIKERYMNRETLLFSESGDTNLSVFVATQDRKNIVLSSALLGINVNVQDTGMNFIFYISAHKTGQTHQKADAILEKGGYWTKRKEEIYVQSGRPSFLGKDFEGEHFYGYSPTDIAQRLLKYVPNTNFGPIDSESVMKSFVSEENRGVQICSIFGTPVYFRIALPTTSEVNNLTIRRATAVLVEEDKIFMRSTDVVAEFVVRSTADRFDFKLDESFDYAKEQEKMNDVAGALYLGLWQHLNNEKNRN